MSLPTDLWYNLEKCQLLKVSNIVRSDELSLSVQDGKFSLWNFSDVLKRLLVIVSQPIHEALSTANLAETFSPQSVLHITVSVVRQVSVLLMKAREISDGRAQDPLNSASVITSLLPHIMASLACMASTDPVAAVKVNIIYMLSSSRP